MTNHTIPIKNSTFGGEYDAYYLSIYAPLGIKVWVHNKSTLPKIERDMIFASSGFFTHIAVERTFESKLEEPYSRCLKDVSKFEKNKKLIDYFLNRNLLYSQTACLDLCVDLFYINENPCGCKQAELGAVFEKCFKIAENNSFVGCTWLYRSNFTKNQLVGKCSEYCPLECDSMSLSYSISTFKDLERKHKSDYILIRIYYKTLKYTSITQQAKTKPEQLISNLGGYLGLFVGLSFVSLFEIIEIIIEFIHILLRKQKTIQSANTLQDIESALKSHLEILKKENQEKISELEAKIDDIQFKLNK
jgi:gas vesicle protein